MRSLVLIGSVVAAYALLRGWPEGWHPLMRLCVVGSVLVFGLILWGRRTTPHSHQATPMRRPRWLDFLSIGVAILVIEAFFLLFFATAPQMTQELAEEIDQKLHPESYPRPSEPSSDQPSENAQGGDIHQTSGNWLWQNNGRRSLGTQGKIRPSNRPEVYLWPTDVADAQQFQSRPLYLRTFTLGRYTQGTWYALPIAPQTLQANDGMVQISDQPAKFRYEINHGPNTLGQSLAVTLPGLTALEASSLRLIAPDTYRLPALEDGQTTYRYQAQSTPLFFEQTSGAPATQAREDYLSLSTDPILQESLDRLIATTSGTPAERLLQLKEMFSERFQYSLETNFDPEEDVMIEFLFNKKSGYCEHFATATALLARALGYPARVAYGWSGGRYYEGPNMFVFRAREAHAWTEIKIEGTGWVIFEATPPSRTEGVNSLADLDEAPPNPDGLDLNLEHDSQSSADSSDSHIALFKLFAASIGGIGMLFLIILHFAKRPAQQPNNQAPGSGLLPTPSHYLTTFQKACSLVGYPMPLGRTLRAHLQALQQEGHRPDWAADLLHYHYSVTYAEHPREKATEKRLLTQLKAWMRDQKG